MTAGDLAVFGSSMRDAPGHGLLESAEIDQHFAYFDSC